MDFTKVLVIRVSDEYKGNHADDFSEEAEGVRKYKGTRNLRIILEQFRTLKAVS